MVVLDTFSCFWIYMLDAACYFWICIALLFLLSFSSFVAPLSFIYVAAKLEEKKAKKKQKCMDCSWYSLLFFSLLLLSLGSLCFSPLPWLPP